MQTDNITRNAVEVKVLAALNTPREIDTPKGKMIVPALGIDKKIISARELWIYCVGKERIINWIESYKTLLKYVSKDYVHIFNPIVNGKESGKRYYVNISNVIDFIYKFETNQLS